MKMAEHNREPCSEYEGHKIAHQPGRKEYEHPFTGPEQIWTSEITAKFAIRIWRTDSTKSTSHPRPYQHILSPPSRIRNWKNRKTIRTEERNNLKQKTELVITHMTHSHWDYQWWHSTSCVTLKPQLPPPGHPNDNHRAQWRTTAFYLKCKNCHPAKLQRMNE